MLAVNASTNKLTEPKLLEARSDFRGGRLLQWKGNIQFTEQIAAFMEAMPMRPVVTPKKANLPQNNY
jgi:hypothetical protein